MIMIIIIIIIIINTHFSTNLIKLTCIKDTNSIVVYFFFFDTRETCIEQKETLQQSSPGLNITWV